MIHGVDTSYANGAVDWAAAKASGLSFAYMRASYGTNSYDDDDNFDSNHDKAKAEGLELGCYFFYLADLDPHAQVAHFLNRISGREGSLRPCIDVEEGSFPTGYTRSVDENIAALGAASAALQVYFNGRLPLIYTNADTWSTRFGGTNAFSGHPLWVASYTTAGCPSMPSGWKTWAIHQYSQSGTINGHGPFDLDVAPDLTPVRR